MKLQVIVGSTRPERVSHKVAQWVANAAQNLQNTTVEVVDLADYPLPLFDEPVSPQYNPKRQSNEVAQKWLHKLSEADAYVLVTPEYNRSTSAVLKNALDYVDFQFAKKPVAIVAHGTTGGAAAVSHLRGIIPSLKAVSVPTPVYFNGQAGEVLNDSGELVDEAVKNDPYGPQAALKAVLEELQWYSDALAAARQQ